MVRAIPNSVKTPLTDVIMDVEELNSRRGDTIFLMIVKQDDHTFILGANSVSDIIFYSDYFSYRMDDIGDPKDVIILRGSIADPGDLPYEVSTSAKIYVLHDSIDTDVFFYMDTATKYIERTMLVLPESEIDDFGVVLGAPLSDRVKDKVLEKILLKRAIYES